MSVFKFLRYNGILFTTVNIILMFFFLQFHPLKIPLKLIFLLFLLALCMCRFKMLLYIGIAFLTIYFVLYILSPIENASINYYLCWYFHIDSFSIEGKIASTYSIIWLTLLYLKLFSKEAKVFYNKSLKQNIDS